MYQTYGGNENRKGSNIDYEEELIPHEIKKDEENTCKAPEKQKGLFDAFSRDDLIIMGVILILMNENCEDKTFLAILVLLLFS